MLSVNAIKNVQSTINNKTNNNRNISFKSGVQTNYGADVINNASSIEREGNFLTDFLGTIKQSPLFFEAFFQRQVNIEKGLETQTNKINALA